MKANKSFPKIEKPAAPRTPKQIFIRQLAEFLVGNQAAKGIMIQVEAITRKKIEADLPGGENNAVAKLKPDFAAEWAKLRGTTPLFGYPSVDEAEKLLADFLA